MDKKDEIILQQLEVIRTMTERNLRSMGDDFWGTPFEGVLSPQVPLRPALRREACRQRRRQNARPAVRWQDRRRSACRQG